MVRVLLFALIASVILLTACSKSGHQTITGTINGKLALTLYGNSGEAADYILLDSTSNQVSYNGQLYSYFKGSGNSIFISVGTASIVSGILTMGSGQTTLTITYANTLFASALYSSR